MLKLYTIRRLNCYYVTSVGQVKRIIRHGSETKGAGKSAFVLSHKHCTINLFFVGLEDLTSFLRSFNGLSQISENVDPRSVCEHGFELVCRSLCGERQLAHSYNVMCQIWYTTMTKSISSKSPEFLVLLLIINIRLVLSIPKRRLHQFVWITSKYRNWNLCVFTKVIGKMIGWRVYSPFLYGVLE